MTIERVANHGIPYLRLTASLGLKRVGERIVQRRKVVLGLGPLSRHDDGKPDYLLRLRESFRAGKPLIKELEPYVDGARKSKVTITFDEGDAKCLGEPKRMAATILDPVFNALGLDEFFASVKFASKIQYDLTGIVRLLTYGRILDPASKSATMEQNAKYYRPLVSSTNDDNVYDALDVIQKHAKQIVQRMNTCVTRGTGRRRARSRSPLTRVKRNASASPSAWRRQFLIQSSTRSASTNSSRASSLHQRSNTTSRASCDC